MTFTEAQNTTMPFGKHKGRTLDAIASTDDGLMYLDWLSGQDLYGKLKDAVETYLSDPSIAKELADILGE